MVVILVGEGEELSDAHGVVGGVGGISSSKKKHENPSHDNDIKHGGGGISVGKSHQSGSGPLQNGLDPGSASSETSPAEMRNGEIGDSSNTQTAIGVDQSSGGSGKRNFSRPFKHTTPTPPTGQITNGLGAQAPAKYGVNTYPKSPFVNAKNKSTTTSITDQYALSSETYDLDFPPSLTSSTPPTSTPPEKIVEKVVEKSEDKGVSEGVNNVGQISSEFVPSSTKTLPKPPGAISSDLNCTIIPTVPSSPPVPDESSVASNQLGGGDKQDTTCPTTKIPANGSRKKGNKAKWVPIQITRAPFRDEFFSSGQGSSGGGPPKLGFAPGKREGNNGGPAAPAHSLGPGGRRAPQAHQATGTPTPPFRRQNSQYNGSQPRDSPTPSNKQQSSPSHDQTSSILDDQSNNDHATTLTAAKGANTITSMMSETVTSQSPPSSVGSTTTDPNQAKSGVGQGEPNPTNATPSNFPLSSPSFRSSIGGKPVQNGPVKVGTGTSSTLPRRPSSHYPNNVPNHRSSGGSSRVSQTLADGPGTTGPAPYNNHHISHNLPLFSGHPGLTRLHLNGGHPLPAYISPTAHHQHPMAAGSGPAGGATFQIPLMAPYPYDNEAYYNYNTVLAHPFFTTHHPHHPPHLYYRSITTTPGLPIHPQHGVGIVNNVGPAGLLPLAPVPGLNQSQQRWNSDAGNNNPNNTNDGGSSAIKASPSQHTRSNSVAALGYIPTSAGPSVPTNQNTTVAAAPVSANKNSTTVDESIAAARATTSALSPTTLAPPKLQQQALTNVRSKSETSAATAGLSKDLAPPPQAIIPAALPSLMSALPPRQSQPVVPLLAPTVGPSTAHYFVQNSLPSPLPGPLLGPSLASVGQAPGPAILVGGGGPEPSPIIVLTGGGGGGISPQFNVPLVDQLRKQIEYYFSEENLHKDLFLRRNMDAQGFIPLSLIATFHRVKMLTPDIYLIRQAIKLSTEVDFVNDRVRTKHNPTIWPITLAPPPPPPQQPHHSNPAHATGPPYAQTPPPSQQARSESSIIHQQSRRNETVSQFPFPSTSTSQNPSIDSLPHTPPLSDDDVKLLGAFLHRDRSTQNPRQLVNSLSPRYFCRYLTRKSYSLPDLSSPQRPGPFQPNGSPAYRSSTLANCFVVTPTEQLTRALRPDPANPYFHLWKECKRTSLLKAAERLTQILTSTFVHISRTQHPADRHSSCTRSSTRDERYAACRTRSNSYPPSPQTLHDGDPSSFLPKFSVCTEPSTLVWCYERPSLPDLAHDSSSNLRKTNPAIITGQLSQRQRAGLKTGSDDLLALLKHEGWITIVPYNTLLQNLQNNDAPGREATLKSLYAFWSRLLIAERNAIDQSLLDLFRETVFKHPDPCPTFRFGIDRLLETCFKCIEMSESQRGILLPKITNDLSRAIQNGGISAEDAKTWVEKSLLPPLNLSTRLRLDKEMPFLRQGLL